MVDREDYWVTGGLVFKTDIINSCEDTYNQLKPQLEAPELVEYIIEDRCLFEDLFKYDKSYKFRGTAYCRGRLKYIFMNDEGNDVEAVFTSDYVYVA